MGKLTLSEQVDTCPCLAWSVWAILNGAFGYAPYLALPGNRGMMGHNEQLLGPGDWTCEDVECLVASIFGVMPWFVLVETRDMPLMTGQLLAGGHFSVYTTSMSRDPSSGLHQTLA